jgi:titin
VNDQAQNLDCVPAVNYGRAMLPVRFIATPIGADVKWNTSERKTTITLNGKTVEIWSGQNIARVNGQYQLIDPQNPNVKAVTVPPGRIMLPIRFISESLGCKVEWNQSLREIKITYPNRTRPVIEQFHNNLI